MSKDVCFDETKKKKYAEKILLLLFVFFIINVTFYRLSEQFAPIILMDEFGYWSNGAYFAGLDWSQVNQNNSYYSYGYSLVLAILIRLFRDSSFLYQASIIVNGIMLIVAFLLLTRIGKTLYEEESNIWVVVCSGLAMLYPSYFGNLHIAWAETFLMLSYIVCIYSIVRCLQKKTIIRLLCMVASFVLCYMIHQRALGVLCCGIFIVILMLWNKKINYKDILIIGIGFIVLFIIHGLIKQQIMVNVFMAESNENAELNNYSSIFAHIFEWFNLEGAKKLIISLSGKIFYLLIGTGGLFGYIIFEIIKTVKNDFVLLKDRCLESKHIIYIFCVMSAGMTIMISSIFTLNATRLDVPVYGRYTEWILAPFILFALIILNKRGKSASQPYMCITLVTLTLFCILEMDYAVHTEWTSFFDVCSYIVAYYKNVFISNGYAFLYLATVVAVASMLLLSTAVRTKKKSIWIGSLIIILFVPNTYWCVNRALASNYRADICKEMDSYIHDTNEEIYFINDYDQGIWYVADLQVMNPDKIFKSITFSELENIEGYVLVGTYEEFMDEEYRKNAVVSNWQISLLHMGVNQ